MLFQILGYRPITPDSGEQLLTFFLHGVYFDQKETDPFYQVSEGFLAPRVGFEPTTLRLTGGLGTLKPCSVFSETPGKCV